MIKIQRGGFAFGLQPTLSATSDEVGEPFRVHQTIKNYIIF
jgi:hypothetical protein